MDSSQTSSRSSSNTAGQGQGRKYVQRTPSSEQNDDLEQRPMEAFMRSSSKSELPVGSEETTSLKEENHDESKAKPKMESLEIELGSYVAKTDRTAISDDDLEALVARGSTTTMVATTESQKPHAASLALSPSADEDDLEENENDMKSLLGSSAKENSNLHNNNSAMETEGDAESSTPSCCCFLRREPLIRMGNIRIFSPRLYEKTGGWGVYGPHWFGPPCILALLLFATHYFLYVCSYKHHLYTTAVICGLLATSTFYNLVNAAYRDPGVILQGRLSLPDPIPRTYRWCEICEYYQPPSAAHCPDCNVCVAGFDHHCVWMGTCIGVRNFKPFMRFNLSWLAYLIYSIVWVRILAPLTSRHYSNADD